MVLASFITPALSGCDNDKTTQAPQVQTMAQAKKDHDELNRKIGTIGTATSAMRKEVQDMRAEMLTFEDMTAAGKSGSTTAIKAEMPGQLKSLQDDAKSTKAVAESALALAEENSATLTQIAESFESLVDSHAAFVKQTEERQLNDDSSADVVELAYDKTTHNGKVAIKGKVHLSKAQEVLAGLNKEDKIAKEAEKKQAQEERILELEKNQARLQGRLNAQNLQEMRAIRGEVETTTLRVDRLETTFESRLADLAASIPTRASIEELDKRLSKLAAEFKLAYRRGRPTSTSGTFHYCAGQLVQVHNGCLYAWENRKA